jgi:hypothetical protein
MSLNVCTWHPVLNSTVSGLSMSMISLQIRICTTDTQSSTVALPSTQCKGSSPQSVKEERVAMSRFKEYEEKHRGYADRSGSTPRPYSIVLNRKQYLLQTPIKLHKKNQLCSTSKILHNSSNLWNCTK